MLLDQTFDDEWLDGPSIEEEIEEDENEKALYQAAKEQVNLVKKASVDEKFVKVQLEHNLEVDIDEEMVEEVYEVDDQNAMVKNQLTSFSASDPKILAVKNLQVSFRIKRKRFINIIRGVDLTLRKGEIIGIVGESGSGKSVATRALMNINRGAIVTCDSFEIFGQKYSSYGAINWKKIRGKEIAYIPQNPMTSMNPSRKIGKQVMDVLINYRKDDLKTKDQRVSYIISIFKKFKIRRPEHVLTLYPHELSGGMKQRVIIAMGIMAGAKVLIADEPTTALDTTVQSSVLKLLQEVNQEFGLSIIFISHNIAIISKLCHYVYVMYAGRVVEKALTKELFTNPKHPYTWALIAAIPEDIKKGEKLYSIPGTPPDLANPPIGDPFAPRNEYAVAIDFKKEPPLFEVSPTHFAATWTLHPLYPKFELPANVSQKLVLLRKAFEE